MHEVNSTCSQLMLRFNRCLVLLDVLRRYYTSRQTRGSDGDIVYMNAICWGGLCVGLEITGILKYMLVIILYGFVK